ncbi:MAG: hypothetical protein HC902_09195 [Calothrix sp. SM1_5_4]|nr:hypothetical protein [Calothrix sp. SM1_5_4]
MSAFRRGLLFWWHGWRYLLGRRGLLVFAVLPMLISSAFAFGFLWLMYSRIGLWAESFVSAAIGLSSGFWYDLVFYPLVFGGWSRDFLFALYLVYILHALVAIPFYSLLAERTLRQEGCLVETPFSFRRLAADQRADVAGWSCKDGRFSLDRFGFIRVFVCPRSERVGGRRRDARVGV